MIRTWVFSDIKYPELAINTIYLSCQCSLNTIFIPCTECLSSQYTHYKQFINLILENHKAQKAETETFNDLVLSCRAFLFPPLAMALVYLIHFVS